MESACLGLAENLQSVPDLANGSINCEVAEQPTVDVKSPCLGSLCGHDLEHCYQLWSSVGWARKTARQFYLKKIL